MQIYNTLTRQKEVFKPILPGKVGIYACGVTVYDYCHLGHARVYTSADVIVRYLRWRGYEVTYIRNITDIDDKIIKRANENQENFSHLTKRFTQAMQEDFAALGYVLPQSEPHATDYVKQMIEMIEKILANGHGYVGKNGDVYFDVRNFPEYGALSHHDIEQLESGARVEVSEVKKDPLDFVLWKLAKPAEPYWDSPWGKGRPGWHIECSVMSTDLLGQHFDIHIGGRDLIFPHHENEMAQSRAALNTPFVNLWMHVGFLQIEKEKMSKSLGNFVTIRDALREHMSEVLRYFYIANHYRSPLIYSNDVLYQAKQALARFYAALRYLPTAEAEVVKDSDYEKKFIEAMDDDFNTPVALSVLFDLAHEIQRLREKNSADAASTAASYAALLKNLSAVLGILQMDANEFFQAGSEIDVGKVENLIAARQQARKEKNWAEADKVRDELMEMGVSIEDNAQGTTWRKR